MGQRSNLDYYSCYRYRENNQHNKDTLKKIRQKKIYKKRKYKRRMIVRRYILLASLLVIFTTGLYCYRKLNDKKELNAIDNNVKVLNDLQNKDVSDVEKNMSLNNKKESQRDKLELGKSILNFTSKDYKAYFNDSVFWGDSITEGFTGYDVLNTNEVVAVKGKTVSLAEKDIDIVATKNPANLYLLFGMNDLENYSDLGDFKDDYSKLLKNVSSKLNNTNIYIMSTMYVNSKASSKQHNLSRDRVMQSNEYIQQICKDNNYTYVDITDIYDKDPSLYEQDGIHAIAKFYPIWLNRLISINTGENKVE